MNQKIFTQPLFAMTALLAVAFGWDGIAFAQDATIEVVAEFDKRPAAPAIGGNGEVYLSMHPFDAPEFKVNQLQKDGSLKPFPTEEISKGFANVIGIKTTRDGNVWMLDMGSEKKSPKLVVWSTTKNKIVRSYSIPKEATGVNPFFQDMAVDQEHHRVYIADMSRSDLIGVSEPAIVVIDLESGETRRVMEGSSMFQPEAGTQVVAGGKPLRFFDENGTSQPIKWGLNPIGIDEASRFVYFSTANPGTVYRIPAKTLADFSSTDEQLVHAVEPFAEKMSSDGMVVSDETVYLTNIAKNGIDVVTKGKRVSLIRDPKFDWTDSLTLAPDGSLYATIDQLHKAPPFNAKHEDAAKSPFQLLRVTIAKSDSRQLGTQVDASPTRELEVVATVDQAVGNIAFADDGDLIVSFHPFFQPDVRVARLDPTTGEYEPFPNREWNAPRPENDFYLDDILGLRSDSDGTVWILDMGTRGDITPKLVGWDTRTDKLKRVIHLPAPATRSISQPNDFAIDESRRLIVIADEGIARGGDGKQGALIVVDMETGLSRRILEGHISTQSDSNHPLVIDGKRLDAGGKPVLVGADGITIDQKSEWLYYCPLNGDKVYRIRMEHVADSKKTDRELAQHVETYSDKPNNGGLSIDSAGNLYFTNVESRSVGFVSAGSREYSVLAKDERMLWPDGISTGGDGFMYVSAAQVHLGAPFNDGQDKSTRPFYIFRFQPVAQGLFGR